MRAATFRERYLSPQICAGRAIFERARDRGEIDADVDLDLLVSVLPALMLYNCTVSGLCGPTDALARRIVEQIVPSALKYFDLPDVVAAVAPRNRPNSRVVLASSRAPRATNGRKSEHCRP